MMIKYLSWLRCLTLRNIVHFLSGMNEIILSWIFTENTQINRLNINQFIQNLIIILHYSYLINDQLVGQIIGYKQTGKLDIAIRH